ncbi:polyketide cyclase [Streptomyces filipinensis]|uniref:Polyketide cyclase n=1 Tax=Streptomyces filipinensis TaxID=66887 RepID=A0A918IBL3_9ACTN|nr:SRPBCC family protein [Streptomyces filipinensis]GGU98066.1 polyketide cyclase [Streptomyces filipinensis]
MSISPSVTKTVGIDRPWRQVFAFLADPANWPRWAVGNVRAIEPTDDPDWWLMSTPLGPARLRLRARAEYGILDHDYVDDTASWQVPARVVPNGEGAEFMITFHRPPSLTDTEFKQQTDLVDTELAALKQVLEGGAAGVTA